MQSAATLSTYCASAANWNDDSRISYVTLAGDAVTVTNTTGGCSTYNDYTGLNNPDLTPGSSYTLTVTASTCGWDYSKRVYVYIDWNRDGDFTDASEAVSTSGPNTADATYNITINVPGSATAGLAGMRIVCVEGTASSCGNYNYGETEDYAVDIQGGSPMAYSSSTVAQASTADVAPGATDQEVLQLQVVTTGSTAALDLTQIQFNTTGSSSNSDIFGITIYSTGTSATFATGTTFGTASAAGGTITVNGTLTLSGGTNYLWLAYDVAASPTLSNVLDGQITQITVDGSNYAPTATNPAGSRTIAVNYCASNATSTADSDIDAVVLNGDGSNINNTSPAGCTGYTDYTAVSPADVTPNNGYTVTVTYGTCNGNYNRYGRVYFDWNQDGDFDDANESLAEQGPYGTTTAVPFNFTVPAGATAGNTRMRVVVSETSGLTSCGTYTYGETEDYTITVNSPTPMAYSSSVATRC